ncbi:hypothetical protein PVAND_008139 [Polypedilum vanderplanki]|uniref:lysozyme n=1 Tax=Polypedilum vanderplanki TaxID=319348 RepID=A0A9J6C971_POLVA|nr:hypothetical protein PVAND_008139 [Polypedilum vanderplanki]
MLIFQIGVIIIILTLSNLITAKIYKKCELAKELSEVHGISWEDVATYTCIAEKQSNFNTQAVGEGQYFGMYQMSSEFWCDNYSIGKACNMHCRSLLDDDLSDDIKCMKIIIDEHQRISGNGFNAWPSGRQCQSLGTNYIAECSIDSNQVHSKYNNNNNYKKATPQQKKTSGNVGKGKVYERCELARELRFKHNIQMDHIATWICIAKHESNFNTSAIGRLNWDGSEDHGLFQISDIYWCGHDGKACGLKCDELEDNDISNDVECIKTIHAEHTRLFGDGFQAWAVYPRCKGQSESYINGCFDDSDNEIIPVKHHHPGIQQPTKPKISHHRSDTSSYKTGKVYDRCELALELRDKHNLPINQIATWVCIAKHESNFNTSAVGRLNWDGSKDHGLFQISDIYWCGGEDGKGCKLSCDDLKDNDISNDVECIKTIHAEHTRLFGDGFQAWAVYPRCKDQSENYIKGCFDDSSNEIIPFTPLPGIQQPKTTYTKTFNQRKQYNKGVVGKGKVYERCELAQELRFKHKISMEQVSTWVCIAKHESNFNTSAIGRLNWDGSEDHGLFQISDIYWCSTSGQGKGCNIACIDLEDNDITDDVECMLKIHEEHTFLSGDGFTAWAVYKPHCKGHTENYINGCFNDNENLIQVKPAIIQPTKPLTTSTTKKITQASQKIIPTTTNYRSSTMSTTEKAKSYETTTSEASTTNENYFDTTLFETTNSPIKYLWNTTSKSFTYQKTIQQKQSTNKPSTIISSSIGKLNEQKITTSTTTKLTTKSSFIKSTSINLKSSPKTKTTSKPLTTRTAFTTFSSTTRKPITQSQTTTRKGITPFDVFAFYLKDFPSKASSIQYEPIKFSDKSTVIFKKADTSTKANAPSPVTYSTTSLKSTTQKPQQFNVINDESYKTGNNLKTTTKSLSIYNLIPSHYISNSENIVKDFAHNRIGRVVSNITPHSFDYLLKLTTPRTFYG